MKSLILFSVGLLAFASQAREAHATCASSTTHFCIDHDGNAFTINAGAEHQVLTLKTGTTYTFEVAGSAVANHPFYITHNADGAGGGPSLDTSDGVSGGPISTLGATLTFTPTTGLIGVATYYQCHIHTGMGGTITIENANGNFDGGTADMEIPPDMTVLHDMSVVTNNDLAGVVSDMTGSHADMTGSTNAADMNGTGSSGCNTTPASPSGPLAAVFSALAVAAAIYFSIRRRKA